MLLEDIQSTNYESNLKKYGEDSNSCICCGKRLNLEACRWINLLIDGSIASHDYGGEESQGAFPVGPECSKKIPKEFL